MLWRRKQGQEQAQEGRGGYSLYEGSVDADGYQVWRDVKLDGPAALVPVDDMTVAERHLWLAQHRHLWLMNRDADECVRVADNVVRVARLAPERGQRVQQGARVRLAFEGVRL